MRAELTETGVMGELWEHQILFKWPGTMENLLDHMESQLLLNYYTTHKDQPSLFIGAYFVSPRWGRLDAPTQGFSLLSDLIQLVGNLKGILKHQPKEEVREEKYQGLEREKNPS